MWDFDHNKSHDPRTGLNKCLPANAAAPQLLIYQTLASHPNASDVLANNAAPPLSGQRPYLLKMLQRHLGTRLVADTLDWDALAHYNFDASALSLDNVYKALKRDVETYYFLWVAVRKVLAEAPSTMFSGARVSSADQKTQLPLSELLDAALQQFLAELGDALMNFVDGPHCTAVDPRDNDDPRTIRKKARSLVARFEKLGRSRDMLMVAIPATESGIEATASLQREDGINVNLTSVSGVVHATACAQAGAVAVTLPIAEMHRWRRGIGRDVPDSGEEDSAVGVGGGGGGEDAETIAAYFQLHGFSNTGLIAAKMKHVDDACPLAALAALSFDADQVRKAEWYAGYRNLPWPPPLALSGDAVRRAKAFPPPSGDADKVTGTSWGTTMKQMDGHTFSTFSAITYSAVGSGRAAMSMIADVARREIEWQLSLMHKLPFSGSLPSFITNAARNSSGSSLRHRPAGVDRVGTAMAAAVAVDARVPAALAHALQVHRPGKRKRSLATGQTSVEAVAEAKAPDFVHRRAQKRARRDTGRSHDHRTFPDRSTAQGEDGREGKDEHEQQERTASFLYRGRGSTSGGAGTSHP
ncbi:hypothetical protein F5148DRAFT_159889 [Russula earlei]|uniref:Uncharacterized protein n=1 Tax=Russula earlei TaxID=71964 RepID=A0ACC0U7G3_9AGAM|nr:hypothetical protein F5148DRAFT_159889 [Russula earlei]